MTFDSFGAGPAAAALSELSVFPRGFLSPLARFKKPQVDHLRAAESRGGDVSSPLFFTGVSPNWWLWVLLCHGSPKPSFLGVITHILGV